MHPFEGTFRRRFRQTRQGYVFQQWGQDVLFTPAEFNEFLRLRRRVWSNPLLWIAYLLGGIVAPIVIWRHGDTASAIAVAVTIGVFVIVPLVHAERKPNEAAEARVRLRPGFSPPASASPWQDVVFLLWIGVQLGAAWHRHDLRWFWGLVALFFLWFGVSGWRLWKRRTAGRD